MGETRATHVQPPRSGSLYAPISILPVITSNCHRPHGSAGSAGTRLGLRSLGLRGGSRTHAAHLLVRSHHRYPSVVGRPRDRRHRRSIGFTQWFTRTTSASAGRHVPCRSTLRKVWTATVHWRQLASCSMYLKPTNKSWSDNTVRRVVYTTSRSNRPTIIIIPSIRVVARARGQPAGH